MSELINNREHRQKILKELILELHDGKSVEEVRERFAHLIEGVSATEISEMEQALLREGMPVEEVQRLCDVHAAVFKGSIEEIHAGNGGEIPGHPVHTLLAENRRLEAWMTDRIRPHLEKAAGGSAEALAALASGLDGLLAIDSHYSKKENLFFPIMELHDITAPPKVMWGVDDEIRAEIKAARDAAKAGEAPAETAALAEAVLVRVEDMIFKEENILVPMVTDAFTPGEWGQIAAAAGEIGFCMIDPPPAWIPAEGATSGMNAFEAYRRDRDAAKAAELGGGDVSFAVGSLSPREIESILNTVPFDMTFVDKDGKVKYFTQGKERIFARPATIIGRKVENCHPPASVHVVEKIVEELSSGKRDHANFWIRLGGQYVHIRYYAVRDGDGRYLGTLEVSQDIAPIQAITGERRLLAEE